MLAPLTRTREYIKNNVLRKIATREMSSRDAYVVLFFLSLMILLSSYEPPDDLKRHLIAYLYGYDYRVLYAFSDLPSYSLYPVFDRVVGWVHASLGFYSFKLVQVGSLWLTGYAVYQLLRGVNGNLRFVIMLAVIGVIADRLLLARPTSFANALFLLSLAWAQNKQVAKPLIAACLLASLYHLFFIYLLPLVFFRRAILIPLILGLCGWVWYAGLEYFQVISSLFTGEGVGTKVLISEAAPIWVLFVSLSIALVPIVQFWKRDIKTALTAVYFSLSNQLRYGETILPLVLSFARYYRVVPSGMVVFLSIVFVAASLVGKKSDSSVLFEKSYLVDSRVLTLDVETMFSVVYVNYPLTVAPSFATGWDDVAIQSVIQDANQTGKLDCGVLQAFGFDYVIEKVLTHVPACLALVEPIRANRIWRVVPRGKNESGV